MQRVPVKTTLGDSSRPQVAMMKSPGTNLHWLSGCVFFVASIGLIAWAISEYNANIDIREDVEIPPVTPSMPSQMLQYPNSQPDESNQLQTGGINSDNLVPFRRPTADGTLPLEQFKDVLQDDLWSD